MTNLKKICDVRFCEPRLSYFGAGVCCVWLGFLLLCNVLAASDETSLNEGAKNRAFNQSYFPTTSKLIATTQTKLIASDHGKIDLVVGSMVTVLTDNNDELKVRFKQFQGQVTRSSFLPIDEACKEFSQRISQYPTQAINYYARGYIYKELGRNDLALADYDRGLEITPNDARLLTRRAFVRSKLGDGPGALTDYDEVIRQRPNDAIAYLDRGYAKLNGGMAREDAESDFKKAYKLAPDEPRVCSTMSWILLKEADYDQAIRYAEEALRIEPNRSKALEYRAMGRAGLGQYERAVEDLYRAAVADTAIVDKSSETVAVWYQNPTGVTGYSGC